MIFYYLQIHLTTLMMHYNTLFSVIFALLLSSVLYGQQTISLYDNDEIPNWNADFTPEQTRIIDVPTGKARFITNVIKPELSIYLPEENNFKAAVVLCPGGGYYGLAIDHEGHDVAKKLNEYGIAVFVLKYRMPQESYFENKKVVPLQDVQRAIQYVRANALNFGVDSDKIGVAGFSAGGHLAASAGVHFTKQFQPAPIHINSRPDFMLLVYPVISFQDGLTHRGSANNLIGTFSSHEKDTLDTDDVRFYSNELQVDMNTPPSFLVHALDDEAVPVENSLLFSAALRQEAVEVETFFYKTGGHGFGMYNTYYELNWVDAFVSWLEDYYSEYDRT